MKKKTVLRSVLLVCVSMVVLVGVCLGFMRLPPFSSIPSGEGNASTALPKTAVLSDSDSVLVGSFAVNIPAIFSDTLDVKKNGSFGSNLSVAGQLQVHTLLVDGKVITAPPSGLQATAGTGIGIGQGTLPVISNTDPGSAQKIFGKVQIDGSLLAADTNLSTLHLVSGNGIQLTPNESTNTIVVEDSLASAVVPNRLMYASSSSSFASLDAGIAGDILSSNGTTSAPVWVSFSSFSKPVTFTSLLSGVNSGQQLTVGNGSVLSSSGSGVLNASQLSGSTWDSPGKIGSGTANTGVFTSVTTSTINGFSLSGSTGSSFIFPALSDTLVGRSSIDTLVHKSIDASGNTITGITNLNLSGTAGITNANLLNASITISAGTGLSGGGVVSLGSTLNLSNTGVVSLLGTADQIQVSGSPSALTVSLPQNISSSSTPTFSTIVLNAVVNSVGGVLYSSATGIGVSSVGISGQCLQSGGALSPLWGVCGTNNWQELAGLISPVRSTDDFAIGGTSTVSAKFQVSGSTGNVSTVGNIALTTANTTIGQAVQGLWTLSGNTYNYRRQLTISNTTGQAIPIYTQVGFSPTGGDLSDVCTTTQPNNNDLRIAYNFVTEISVNTTRNCPSSLTANFELQRAISAGQVDTYYVYYGNTSLASGSLGYSYANTQIDSMDSASSWVSSDSSNALVSQETTIKQEGTGSLKITEQAEASGNVGTWSTSGQGQLPVGLYGTQVAQYTVGGTTYFYSISGQQSGVYRAQLDQNGNIGAWSSTGQGQATSQTYSCACGYTFIATSAGTTYIYILTNGVARRASLDASGNIGTWTATGQTIAPVPGAYTSYTIGGTTYLYTISGFSTPAIYRSQLDASGNIGAWSSTGQSPYPNVGSWLTSTIVSISGTTYFYGFGGNTVGVSTVYRAQIDSGGNVGTWSSTGQTPFPVSVELAGSYVVNLNGINNMYVFGGVTSSGDVATVYRSQIDSSGNIGAWTTVLQTPLPQTLSHINGSVIYSSVNGTNYFYVFGGSNNAVASSAVYRAPLIAPVNTISRSISARDLSKRGGIQFSINSSRTGSGYLMFDMSNDSGTTWQSYPVTIQSANAWQTVTIDITGLSSTQRNSISQLRFRIVDPTVAATIYIDDLESLVSPYSGTTPTVVNASASLTGAMSNLSLNAQGYGGLLNLNYDPSNGTAGTGGLALYNGGSTKLFSIDSSGNVRVLGGALCVKADQSSCNGGVALTPGTIYATSQSISAADYAENYVSSQNLEPGDVVALAHDMNNSAVVMSTSPYQSQALGIVSTNPGVTINSDAQKDDTHPNVYPIALLGRVPLKVSTANGIIHAGDSLTTSFTPGVAMKATGKGQLIGKALESYDTSDTSAVGKIMVYVNVTYGDATSGEDTFAGQSQQASLSAQTQSFITVPPAITSDTLTTSLLAVSGKATFADVGITGTMTMGLLRIEGMHASDTGATASITTLSGPLQLQASGLNGIEFENGKATIDTQGTMVLDGDLTVKTIHAQKISVTDTGVAPAVGSVTIPAGHTTMSVSTSALTPNSRIFATPVDVPIGVSTSQLDETTIRITIDHTQTRDVNVNWWIIN